MSGSRKIFGVGPVRELLTANARGIEVIYVDAGRAASKGKDPVAEIVAAALAARVVVTEKPGRELDALLEPGNRHQGVIAITGAFSYAHVDDFLTMETVDGKPPLVVALDGVQDPHNLGAIIRSAYVLGAHGIVIPEHRAAEITSTVTKASAGATELLPVAHAVNLVRALETLKEGGLWITAVAATAQARPIGEIDLRGPSVLVLGAEGSGVRPLVAKTCDFHAVIPMAKSGVGSLNVSVAAGIALYEANRQRAAPLLGKK